MLRFSLPSNRSPAICSHADTRPENRTAFIANAITRKVASTGQFRSKESSTVSHDRLRLLGLTLMCPVSRSQVRSAHAKGLLSSSPSFNQCDEPELKDAHGRYVKRRRNPPEAGALESRRASQSKSAATLGNGTAADGRGRSEAAADIRNAIKLGPDARTHAQEQQLVAASG